MKRMTLAKFGMPELLKRKRRKLNFSERLMPHNSSKYAVD